MNDAIKLSELLTKPTIQRIVQYLLLHEKGTSGEIAAELSDVPRATLYRNIALLVKVGAIYAVKEEQKRGVIEKTYAVNKELSFSENDGNISKMIQSLLLSIMQSFAVFFESGGDPIAERLSITSSTLMLSDDEFMSFYKKIGEVYKGVLENKADGKRKPRTITVISSPNNQKE